MGFKLNRAGMERLQRELEEKFLGGLQVPKGGSEEDAVRSVRDQLVPCAINSMTNCRLGAWRVGAGR